MRLNLIIASIASLLLAQSLLNSLLLKTLNTTVLSKGLSARALAQPTSFNQLSSEKLYHQAKSITVRVVAGTNSGSGILIQRQGQVYTVLTNDHVVNANSSHQYQIETPDGKVYAATVNWSINFNDNDLSVLQFRSSYPSYALAILGSSSPLRVGDNVFAAGFPSESDFSRSRGFVMTTGKISLLIEKALMGGYQNGYTNLVQSGMSGGPLLNSQGEVVGINGMTKYPLWGNSGFFKDGSVPPEAMRQQIPHYSWAIPIETFLRLAPHLN